MVFARWFPSDVDLVLCLKDSETKLPSPLTWMKETWTAAMFGGLAQDSLTLFN